MIFTKKRSSNLSRRQLFAGAAAVAILPALPAFAFSENAARALLLPRRQPGRRMPLWLQRRKAADLLNAASRYERFPIMLNA